MDVHVLRHFREELAWATDKQLQVISNIMLSTTLMYATMELKSKSI